MIACIGAGAHIASLDGLDGAEAIRRAAMSLAPTPLRFNVSMSATGLPLTLAELTALGVRVVICPGDARRAAIAGLERAFTAVLCVGDSRIVASAVASWLLREEVVTRRR